MQQFISDMENLHRQTKDENFSIIIVDFESEDMDVEQALRESSVPRSVSKTLMKRRLTFIDPGLAVVKRFFFL